MKTVLKDWGHEIWIENNELYCGKELLSNGKWSSKGKFHYHPIKDETFYIVKGVLQIDVGLENGWINSTVLREGEKMRIKPTIRHRFKAIGGDSTFIEFSTTHKDEDSIRCYFDEEEKKWIDVES